MTEQSLNIDIEKENKEIINEYRKLLRRTNLKKGDPDILLIRKAFDFAVEAHKDVRRKSGEPYIFHPIAVAQIVVEEIGLGTTSVVCALLHDVVEDTHLTIEDIDRLFGKKVAKIIDGLTKIEEVFDQSASLQAENFRKIILTLADDVRVILIKLADRLHNMRTLESMRKDKQLKIASETLYIYAPLAHRLGLYQIKSELEDLALKYKAPHLYSEIVEKLRKTKAVRTRFINRFNNPIKKALDGLNVQYVIKGRPKSVYSIWNKMRKQNIPFEQVYDVFAIRIIVDSLPENEKTDCWNIYSVITDFYQPNPDRLRDWISTPKANGYESLHTTVMSPTGKWVEVQIRTTRMDEIAERGYAAHWKYKENSKENALDTWIARVREVLENPELNAIDFVDDFKLNLFAKEIFAFTPKGDIRSLPHNATALDFAFEIHSELGRRCVGAKVNQKLVPISYQLNSGDQIEIITSKAQTPSEEWLGFVVTARAKTAIKAFLRIEKKKLELKGEKIIEEQLQKNKLLVNEENFRTLKSLFNTPSNSELFIEAAKKNLDLKSLKKARKQDGKLILKTQKRKSAQSLDAIVESTRGNKAQLVIGSKTKKLDYRISTCCNPIPGDEIVGFITKDGKITIHRVNCPNTVKMMSNYGYRVVRSKWDDDTGAISFLASIQITGIDRTGLVNEITKVISNEMNVNIRSLQFDGMDGVFEGKILVYVNDTSHLKNLREKIKAIQGVMKVNRIE